MLKGLNRIENYVQACWRRAYVPLNPHKRVMYAVFFLLFFLTRHTRHKSNKQSNIPIRMDRNGWSAQSFQRFTCAQSARLRALLLVLVVCARDLRRHYIYYIVTGRIVNVYRQIVHMYRYLLCANECECQTQNWCERESRRHSLCIEKIENDLLFGKKKKTT